MDFLKGSSGALLWCECLKDEDPPRKDALAAPRSPSIWCDMVSVVVFVIISWCSGGTVQELVAAPRSLSIRLACGVRGHDLELWGHGSHWFGWTLSQSLHCGSCPIVGRIIHVSCWTVFGWWVAILAATTMGCCLVYAVWHRDGIWLDWDDHCPLGPCGVSAACLLLSERTRLTRLDLSVILLGVRMMERPWVSCTSYG
jgi:hypothetical protein